MFRTQPVTKQSTNISDHYRGSLRTKLRNAVCPTATACIHLNGLSLTLPSFRISPTSLIPFTQTALLHLHRRLLTGQLRSTDDLKAFLLGVLGSKDVIEFLERQLLCLDGEEVDDDNAEDVEAAEDEVRYG